MGDYEIRIVRQEKILIKAEATKGRDDKHAKGGWKKGKRCKKKWKPTFRHNNTIFFTVNLNKK